MAEKSYYEQIALAENYLIPYFRQHIPEFEKFRVLEVGCAEGGVLKVLRENGLEVTGLDIAESRIETALRKNPDLDIRFMDITDRVIIEKLGQFDLVIMREVIEHVPDREAAFSVLHSMLRDGGYLYITFPPRYSGFAGHQQTGRTFLKFTPYIHILPRPVLAFLIHLFRERPILIDYTKQMFREGLTIRSFEKYIKKYSFKPVVREYFLFRPVYQVRFNLKPRRIPNIPLLREVLAFGCENLLQKSG